MNIQNLKIVTSNKDKLKEINQILGTNFKLTKINIPEIQSLNLDEVIKSKAISAYQKINSPVLVEDISFEIKALKGLPGTFIKFFLNTLGAEGTVALVGNKKTDTKVTNATAIYDGKTMKIFKGTKSGMLSKKNKGEYGFGFDKVFIPNGFKITYAQMPPELKNKISHRAIALRKVKKYLNKIQ